MMTKHVTWTLSWTTAAVVALLSGSVQGEGSVMCYECESWIDKRCDDPFNFSLPLEKQPPLIECDGCCVKLVRNLGTHYASVKRTCTEKLRINLFVVDRVCMLEGGGRGHMCFCETDLCNAAPPSFIVPLPFPSTYVNYDSDPLRLLTFILIFLFHSIVNCMRGFT